MSRCIKPFIAGAFLIFCLSGCTLMLAGAIVEAIVTEVKSKKKDPETKETVYYIAAEDRREKIAYIVEVYVKTQIDKKRQVMIRYVDKMVMVYPDKEYGDVALTDVEGDGFFDEVRFQDKTFFPPVPYSSGEYLLRKNNGTLGSRDPLLEIDLAEETPWYLFSARERLEQAPREDSPKINVYPLQQRFTMITLAALRELNFQTPTP